MNRPHPLALTLDELQSNSVDRVEGLLSPLRSSRHGERVCLFTTDRRGFVLSTSDELNSDKYYRDRRLQTDLTSLIYFCYFEEWAAIPGEKGKFVEPKTTYLHLYKRPRNGTRLEELMCLHSDPMEPSPHKNAGAEAIQKYKYKRSPHFHVLTSQDPFPHSHFPLNLGHLDDTLSSVEKLTKAMGDAINIIKYEIINRIIEMNQSA